MFLSGALGHTSSSNNEQLRFHGLTSDRNPGGCLLLHPLLPGDQILSFASEDSKKLLTEADKWTDSTGDRKVSGDKDINLFAEAAGTLMFLGFSMNISALWPSKKS
jgi:hypothetical protein